MTIRIRPFFAARVDHAPLALLALSALFAYSCGGDTPPTGGGSAGSSAAGRVDGGAGGEVAGGSAHAGAATGGSGGTLTEAGSAGTEDAAGSVAAAGEAGADNLPGPRPNILFVLSDDLSWNLVKYMPNVLKMQQEGVSFANYFVSDSLCCPSRTSMFTGKYPHNSGVFTNTGDDGGYATYLSQGNDPETFAVALESSGYRTSMMGKFLNGYDPQANQASLGWTSWAVAGNGYPEFNYDLNQNGKLVHHAHADADYLTDVLSGLGSKFIAPGAKPFMIELATFAPHAPYTPAPRHAALFPTLGYPQTPAFNVAHTAQDPDWLKAVATLTPAEVTKIDEIFRQRVRSVQAIDEMIGALRAQLKASGQDKNSYVVFTSDNGYHMGEHSQMPGKMTAFDTDIHVPLVVVGPGVPAGVEIPEIAQNIDLCPTFAELGQAPAPATVNGRSLVPLLHGEQVAAWRDVALVEHHDPKYDPNDPDADTGVVKNPPTYNALRTVDSVYVEYVGDISEYHDRTTDPYELHNTATALTPARVAQLHGAITAITSCKTSAACWAAQHLTPAK